MKKSYEKPNIELVSFALCSSVASGCGTDTDEIGMFGEFEGCRVKYDPENPGSFCYDIPTDDTRLMTS